MAKAPRSSPGVGHNGPPVEHGVINQALADIIFYDEQVKLLNEKKKAMRKGWEGRRVILSEVDNLAKMKDEPESKIIEFFKTRFHYLGAVFTGLPKQFDLFTRKVDAPEKEAAYRHMGLMAGIKGEDPTCPANLSGEALQLWTDGYNEGAGKREKSRADFLATVLATDGVIDGTNKGGTAAIVRAQSAADFAKDNPGVNLGEKIAPPAGDPPDGQEAPAPAPAPEGSPPAGDPPAGDPPEPPEPPAEPPVDEKALADRLAQDAQAFKDGKPKGGRATPKNLAKTH